MTEVDYKNQIDECIEINEFDISHYCEEDSEKCFAEIIGCIENIIISEPFLEVQNSFLEKYYKEFVDGEENRLIYMDIFQDYLKTVEKYIEEQLIKSVPGFDIRGFEIELERRPEELDEEIYEMLSTFWDFDTFKQMFIEYKKMKEGISVDFSNDILITKCDVHNN